MAEIAPPATGLAASSCGRDHLPPIYVDFYTHLTTPPVPTHWPHGLALTLTTPLYVGECLAVLLWLPVACQRHSCTVPCRTPYHSAFLIHMNTSRQQDKLGRVRGGDSFWEPETPNTKTRHKIYIFWISTLWLGS